MQAELHSRRFWLGIVSTILAIAVAFGVHVTAVQEQTLLAAAGIVISLILGDAYAAGKHAANSQETAQTGQTGENPQKAVQ